MPAIKYKGQIGQWLIGALDEQGLQLITILKKNIKPVLRTDFEKDCNGQLKQDTSLSSLLICIGSDLT